MSIKIADKSDKFMFEEKALDLVTFKISNFEGPLDLLNELIKNAKIDIIDIFISEITDQFIKLLKDIDELEMETASEFIEMAARLLEIKSRSLLPNFEEEAKDEDSPENALIRQLQEYKLFKEASDNLKPHETLNRFFRDPDYSEEETRVVYNNFSFDKLIDAFAMMLHKVEKASLPILPREIVRDRFTVAEKISYVRNLIIKNKILKFNSLFELDYTRSEAINTFLALLELLKIQIIFAIQEELYGDILIKLNEEGILVDGKTNTDN